jgi:tRNA-(ms[2]io[6]A)-hydroxylase
VPCKSQAILLIDHANCEKKAASTALGLMYRHTDQLRVAAKMSRLAREELRHFEQVIAIMKKRGIAYEHVTASALCIQVCTRMQHKRDPERLVDTLIMGAIIEARSCERFAALAPLFSIRYCRNFIVSLLQSEARHFMDYLALARSAASDSIDERVRFFLERERELIEGEDGEFRFHSGVPAN